MNNYEEKFITFIDKSSFSRLESGLSKFIKEKSFLYQFSYQEFRWLCDAALDLSMWQEKNLDALWPVDPQENHRVFKSKIMASLRERFDMIRSKEKDYSNFKSSKLHYEKINFSENPPENKVLGRCPVASEKTRCCNLETLDAVRNCGLDCSYCSIQSFFYNDSVIVETDLAKKLDEIDLDPNEIYHIGTGQSSDSLLWGNQGGILDSVLEFARKNKNVVLELKTKSKNIAYMLSKDIPDNVISTWSLNPQIIIDNEEHKSATLDERLECARKIADKGKLVGFHFHPMIYYKGWESDYLHIVEKIITNFKPHEVAMISIGTLTFIKSVMKQIRKRDFASKILQMEFVDADGKLSYPDDIKIKLFKHLYDSFSAWHNKVFFYLCMENPRFWKPVFGYEYSDNIEFETAMKTAYINKINKMKF